MPPVNSATKETQMNTDGNSGGGLPQPNTWRMFGTAW